MTPSSGPRKRLRLENYNYSTKGAYFVTIDLKSDILFGYIRENKVKYNKAGFIAVEAWKQIPMHYSNIYLDEYIVMPDHVHGIILILKDFDSEKTNKGHYGQLSKIIKSFKEVVTKEIKAEIPKCSFGWQRSFYDHIIENEAELIQIRKYIIENPEKASIKYRSR